jgi:hypothetical protein
MNIMQKMENNYRTPFLEEFVEGFEYEECNNGKWYPRKTAKIEKQNPCEITSFKVFFDQIKNNFRVKMENDE